MYQEQKRLLDKVIKETERASFREGVGNLRKAMIKHITHLIHQKGAGKHIETLRDVRRFVINWKP